MSDQDPGRSAVTGGPGRVTNRGMNLSREDRARGGERSARLQERDARGHFAGRKKGDAAAGTARAARTENER